MKPNLKQAGVAAAALAGLTLACHAWSAPLSLEQSIPVSGIESIGEFGDPANNRLVFDLAPGGEVKSIAWDVSLSAFGSSWLSDLALALTNSDGDGVFITPSSTDAPGSGNFRGSVWLPSLGENFTLGADGKLFLEFFETLDDFAGADGRWNNGFVLVSSVPEPGTLGLLGAALAAAALTSRRRKA